MNKQLKELTESIYNEFSPLENIDKHLFNKNTQGSFQKLFDEKSRDLSDSNKKRLHNELFGWGPIEELIQQEDLFDIIIQGPDHIYFETSKGLRKWHDHFLSRRSFNNFKELLLKESKILVNQRDPFGNGKARGFRVHLATPPIAPDCMITLRKHNPKVFSMDQLLHSQFVTHDQREVIEGILQQHKNFLIVGPTGSGKTTFLNSLISELPDNERVVIIEDTDEIKSTNPLTSKLLAREICPDSLKPIYLEDLVKQSLRMRPDRIVVGEVRGPEAKDLLQALATGHSGSMGTIHAHSARQALIRLEMLIQMGAPQWSLHSIRQLIQLSLDYLIVLSNDRMNKQVIDISKISGNEDFGLLLEKVHKTNKAESDHSGFLKFC